MTAAYTSYDADETAYADAGDVTGDTVIDQSQTWYDEAGEPVATATYERLPDDTTTTGPLTAANSYATAAVAWYDGLGREVATADYGREDVNSGLTHYFFDGTTGALIDADGDGLPDVAEASPPKPLSQDPNSLAGIDFQLSLTDYNAAGLPYETIDNLGRINETLFDAAGRTVRTIQNYDDGAAGETDTDKDITVDYQYDSGGRLATMTAYNAKGSGNGVQEQATKYLYTSAIDASWQTAVVYPDSTDTLSQDPTTLVWTITAGSDHASTAYDQLGRTTETTDQRGVVHDYTFDSAGRPEADTATSLGSSGIVDGSIRRIGTAYDDVGRVQTVTSYSDTAGTVIVNQTEDRYDGWANLVQEWQSHSGAVDEATTPSVQYTYDDGASGGIAKYVRVTDVIYPNGRDVKYSYGQLQAIDDIMSRLATISDGSDTYAAYRYLGANDIVTEDFQQADVKLDYSANNLASLDRFARVADQVWASYGANPATLDEYDYGYDRAGNRTSRANAVDSALSELYGYNGVDELTSWSVNGVQQRTWSPDALGNDLASGTYSAANEETPTQGSSGYDLAGNMDTLQSGQTAKYDAWNRLVEVDDASGIVEKFAYDGTDRRIQTASDFTGSTPATVVDDYLAGQQVIESDITISGTRNGGYQYVWSPCYIDAPILRDTLTTDGTATVAAERVYYLSDANYNVTALVKYDSGAGEWQVAEHYTYDPYGVVTYRNADWTTATSSANANTVLYAGRSFDSLTSLYYNRARYFDPGLERFFNRDPIGYLGGDANLYRYAWNRPTDLVDSDGLAPWAPSSADLEMASAVNDAAEYLKQSGWRPKNPRNPGEFGNALHETVSQRLVGKAGRHTDVYVERGTNRIVSIGSKEGVDFRKVVQVDAIKMKNGAPPLGIGDILDPNFIEGVYDVKSTNSLSLGRSQAKMLGNVRSGWGTIPTREVRGIRSSWKWTRNRGWVSLGEECGVGMRVLNVAKTAGKIGVAALPLLMLMAAPDKVMADLRAMQEEHGRILAAQGQDKYALTKTWLHGEVRTFLENFADPTSAWVVVQYLERDYLQGR